MSDDPIKSKDTFAEILAKLDVDINDPFPTLCLHWKEIVGERLYEVVRVVELKRNTLVLKCTHPAWSASVQMQKEAILNRIKEVCPQLQIKSLQILSR